MTSRHPTRERILVQALRLFAERGFRATTVGDIEEAAGLAPRRGSLYKHFPSKEEVLRAVLERHAQRMEGMESVVELMPAEDSEAEFLLLVRAGLAQLHRDRDLIRLVIREGDRFPELAAYRERLASLVLRGTAEWIRRQGGDELDAEAVAAVFLGAIVHWRVDEALYGSAFPGVDEERFVAALAQLWSGLTA
ncbi:MAG: TetR/AcrR family transcriptional regulator [Thermoleophilaceae bacterium]